ncbi:MAG: heme NO-binding domain-containing protein [Rhodobacteraceae bacterium]|nr:heme NO-binding domain-containing protein [Paracoccaceae bacterium]
MLGLVIRAFQRFIEDTYGAAAAAAVAQRAGLPVAGVEAMRIHQAGLAEAAIAAAEAVLGRPRAGLLEDFGTHLVSRPDRPALRRLLRFGGAGFRDFLASIEDLPGRARLALPELALPQLELEDRGGGRLTLSCRPPAPDLLHVAAGILRALADDYGALVVVEPEAAADGGPVLAIDLLDARFAAARPFALVAGAS